MSPLRWTWYVLALLMATAGTFVCNGGLGPDPHGYVGMILDGED